MASFGDTADAARRRTLAVLGAAAILPLVRPALGAGSPAPVVGALLSLPDTQLLDGKVLRAADVAGKVMLVKYWATWCPICVSEMPQLQRFYAVHRHRGFESLALSLGAGAAEVELFWEGTGYQFPVAMNTPAHTRTFGQILGTPTFFLLDRKGVLRQRVVGPFSPRRMEEVIVPLLGAPA
ncbi:MAG: TlpA family protein disulfide reductase [Pseudomonadota bacterium]